MADDMIVEQCKTCGVKFGVLRMLRDSFCENGGYMHCTNGHAWGWDKSASKRAAEERVHQRNAQRVAELTDEVAAKEREIKIANEKTARLKKRVSAGTCPCCKRSFRQLALHMKSKHPELSKPRLAEAI